MICCRRWRNVLSSHFLARRVKIPTLRCFQKHIWLAGWLAGWAGLACIRVLWSMLLRCGDGADFFSFLFFFSFSLSFRVLSFRGGGDCSKFSIAEGGQCLLRNVSRCRNHSSHRRRETGAALGQPQTRARVPALRTCLLRQL